MEYTFDIAWFIGGILVTVAGVVILRFYRAIADNFFLKYTTVQIVAVIFCAVGILSATNLMPFLLGSLINLIIPKIGY